MRFIIVLLVGAACSAQTIDYARQITNKPSVDVREHQWYRTNGSGASADLSTAGAKTITLTKCPLGVAGSNTNHYVRIYDGTGTAEAALITGGTCTSGAASGTLTLTTANTHAGSWKIGTATAGIQEAVNSLVGNGGVDIPAGQYTVYAASTVSGSGTTISGVGMGATTIVDATTDADPVFRFTHAITGSRNSLRNLMVDGSSRVAGGYVLEVDEQNTFFADNLYFYGSRSGILIDGASTYNVYINDSNISGITGSSRGISIENGGGHYLHHVEIGGGSPTPAYGIYVAHSGAFYFSKTNTVGAGTGLALAPGNGQTINWGWATDCSFDTGSGYGIEIAPSGTGIVKSVNFASTWTASNALSGVSISGGGSTTVDGIRFLNHRSVNNVQHGYLLNAGPINVIFDHCDAMGNSSVSSGTYHGFAVAAAASKFSIKGGIYAQAAGFSNTQGYGILIAAGASDNYTIEDTVTTPNTAGTIGDSGTGTTKFMRANRGVSDVVLTIASAATITLTPNDVYYVTGTTPIATIDGGAKGRQIVLIFTDASPGGLTTGGNIPRAQSAAQYQSIRLTFDGSSWF